MKNDRHELNLIEAAQSQSGRPESGGLDVQLNHVSRRFGSRQILRNFNLSLRSGEFLAIVGRSGCGKSTLLRLLSGIDQPDSGDILLGGKAPEHALENARIMFQDARLLPWKTVAQNVALGLKASPEKVRQSVNDALYAVGLADRADEWPARLSGGQKQRVALARALIHRPKLLLLDEPLGALDALTRLEMQQLIESLWRQHGFTVVLVTHDVSEAVTLADRIVILEEGQITYDETTHLPRPREQGLAAVAQVEGRILRRLTKVNAVNNRNQIQGLVSRIEHGIPLSEVYVRTPVGTVSTTVSSRDLQEHPLETGAAVVVFFKSTEVILATPHQ